LVWVPSAVHHWFRVLDSVIHGSKAAWAAWIMFKCITRLSRLESRALSWTGLTLLHLSASIAFIREACFALCSSLASIAFEAHTRLSRLESRACYEDLMRDCNR
jgi:hypothetical protein